MWFVRQKGDAGMTRNLCQRSAGAAQGQPAGMGRRQSASQHAVAERLPAAQGCAPHLVAAPACMRRPAAGRTPAGDQGNDQQSMLCGVVSIQGRHPRIAHCVRGWIDLMHKNDAPATPPGRRLEEMQPSSTQHAAAVEGGSRHLPHRVHEAGRCVHADHVRRHERECALHPCAAVADACTAGST